jgi:hypothetical protein
MMLVSIGIALIIVGVVLFVLLEGIFGELLVVAGGLLMLYKLFRAADAESIESIDRQAEIDARADEVRTRHQNPV